MDLGDSIDFDAARTAWLSNKRPIGGGCYEYICQYIHSNGKQCRKGTMKGSSEFCKRHRISGRLITRKHHEGQDHTEEENRVEEEAERGRASPRICNSAIEIYPR